MTRKAPRKKVTRRLKRSVRKSCAAILMITAIIVAMIPVPETLADSGTAGTVTVRSDQPQYDVDEGEGDFVNISGLSSLREYQDSNGTGYRVIKVGDSWQLHWMFRYYQDNNFGNDNTIVTKYNDNYPQTSIDMGMSVYPSYTTVEESDYEDWLNNTLRRSTVEWRLTSPTEGPELTQIRRYFPTAYENYVAEWESWNRLSDDEKRTTPAPVGVFKEADVAGTDNNAKQYYCETVNPRNPAYRLVSCKIPTPSVSGGDTTLQTAYIPRLITAIAEENDETVSEQYTPRGQEDANGFLAATELTAVVAIAPKAFQNVVNLREVTLPSATKYIGDMAFQHATSITQLSGEGIMAIGNRTFQGCTSIENMNIMAALQYIGTEAFRSSGISDITFAHSLLEIGPGAFADCPRLATITVENAARAYFKVGNYAFYNCPMLENFDWNTANDTVTTIGDGAFAFSSTTEGVMTEFSFPHGTASTAAIELGDYIFANRTGLKRVTMPEVDIQNLSGTRTGEVPEFTFLRCYNLDWVEFPADSNCMAKADITYPQSLFTEVVNPGFYVKGPKYKKGNNREPALCRRATWVADAVGLTAVPYRFTDTNGMDYYEICQTGKLLLVDDDGALISCTFEPPSGSGSCHHVDDAVEIPAYAGDRLITSLASGSFDQEDLQGHRIKDYITEITFDKDCQIQAIDDEVFKNCPKLKKVVLSGSVESIGKEAFANCGTNNPSTVFDVTFDTPNNSTGNVTLGEDAFTTGGSPIIFRGVAKEDYGPYEHAIDPETYANRSRNLRICYRTIAPQNMTIIIDNGTNDPVLVGYPFYENVDADNTEMLKEMERYFTEYYADPRYDDYRVTSPGNGPWDEDTDGDGISEYFDAHPYSLLDIYESIQDGTVGNEPFQQMTLDGQAILDGVFNIVVPSGVTSIDTQAYFDNVEDNGYNITEYLENERRIFTASAPSSAGEGNVVPGLFSGYFREDRFSGEQLVKGNDYVQTITLTDVKKLPNNAFDSCENLTSVDIGAACTDIGEAPFRNCTLISQFVGNDKFSTDGSGIIYSQNNSGHKTVETCMPTRGTRVNGQTFGSTTVSAQTDPTLADVNYIKPGAFESCAGIRYLDLRDVGLLTEITPQAFKDCTSLQQAVLPDNINAIEEEAFANDIGITALIYGREVSIRNNAFPHGDDMTLMRSLEDSAAHRYANTYQIEFRALDDNSWVVRFMDYDGTYLEDEQYIEDGKPAAIPSNPVRTGYTFTGWSPTVPNMSPQNITADVTFVAQYKANTTGSGTGTGTKDPNDPNNQNKPVDEKDKDKKIYTVTVINGSGSGTYEEGKKVNITANAPSTGRKFDRWETTSQNVSIANVKEQSSSFTMPANNVVVTAVYDGGNGSSGNKNTTGSSSGVSGNSAGGNTGSSGSNGAASNGTGNGNGVSGVGANQNGTRVDIGNNIGVSNTGIASATVDGSTDNFVVRIAVTPEATAAVEAALTKEYGTLSGLSYFPMDITLYDSNGVAPILDTTGLSVNITMPIPDDLIPYAGNNKAGAVVGDNVLEKLGATFKTIDGVPCINFTATHFSPYTIYVDGQANAGMDASPKTGDPIHPKWFLAIGLACLSVVLFLKRDKKLVQL